MIGHGILGRLTTLSIALLAKLSFATYWRCTCIIYDFARGNDIVMDECVIEALPLHRGSEGHMGPTQSRTPFNNA